MAEADKESKTEQPTGKRLSEAREKGNIPRSQDLTSTLTLLGSVIALYSTGGFMVGMLKKSTRELLGDLGTYPVTEAGVYTLFLKSVAMMGSVLAPFVLVVMLIGIVASISQGGIVFSLSKLELDINKLNPINGVSKLFNKEALFEIAKSLVKILIVGYIAYQVLRDEMDSIIYLPESNIQGIVDFVSRMCFKIVLHTAGVMLVLGVLDYAFVRWRYYENLKMTKEEVKEETKQAEGNPQIKGKIRSMQYANARRRLKKIIPTADVVITNPTHFAVALKYDREKMGAPVVLAKGMDYLALKIKEIAREEKVMLVENRFLARELYAQVNEGEEIPESLYAAVAEVLAYVYSLKGKI